MEYNVHFVRYRPFCGENGRTRGGLFYNMERGPRPARRGTDEDGLISGLF